MPSSRIAWRSCLRKTKRWCSIINACTTKSKSARRISRTVPTNWRNPKRKKLRLRRLRKICAMKNALFPLKWRSWKSACSWRSMKTTRRSWSKARKATRTYSSLKWRNWTRSCAKKSGSCLITSRLRRLARWTRVTKWRAITSNWTRNLNRLSTIWRIAKQRD